MKGEGSGSHWRQADKGASLPSTVPPLPLDQHQVHSASIMPRYKYRATTPDELYRSAYEDYMRGNYDLAADGFGEYLRRWPDTELSDNALYWIGEW